jgi:hypothetical protein
MLGFKRFPDHPNGKRWRFMLPLSIKRAQAYDINSDEMRPMRRYFFVSCYFRTWMKYDRVSTHQLDIYFGICYMVLPQMPIAIET